MDNWQSTVISQYRNSPAIMQLLDGWNQSLAPDVLIDVFYDKVWNIQTAQGYGLDVWGRIVGVQRVIKVAAGKYLGFEEATTASADPFNQSPYYSGQPSAENYALSDDAFRLLIFAKAAANIFANSIPTINNILLLIFFGRGKVYVVDNEDMTMDIVFDFTPTPVERSILDNSGVLPIPAGVSVNIVVP